MVLLNKLKNKLRINYKKKRWPGLIEAYKQYLPVTRNTPIISLNEGNTPLIFSNIIPHYGYYGDYTKLIQCYQKELDTLPNEIVSDLIDVILIKMAELFISNLKLYKKDPNSKSETALFFKWLPREGLSIDKSVNFDVNNNGKCHQLHFVKALIAKILIIQNKSFPQNKKDWNMTLVCYRKVIKCVMKTLNVPETFMCAGDWNLIDPKNVPSRASMIYRKAFFNINKDGTILLMRRL